MSVLQVQLVLQVLCLMYDGEISCEFTVKFFFTWNILSYAEWVKSYWGTYTYIVNTFESNLCHGILYILRCSGHNILKMGPLWFHFDTEFVKCVKRKAKQWRWRIRSQRENRWNGKEKYKIYNIKWNQICLSVNWNISSKSKRKKKEK